MKFYFNQESVIQMVKKISIVTILSLLLLGFGTLNGLQAQTNSETAVREDTICQEICQEVSVGCEAIEDCQEVCGPDPDPPNDDDSNDNDNTASKTVYTTESAPDLDTSDRLDFKNELRKGGYKHIGDKTRVRISEFNNLLGRSDIKALYHASHGVNGAVMLMDRDLTCGNSAKFKVENVIFATCLTLRDKCWKQRMGSTSKTILGYTKVSYDGIANTNAIKFGRMIVDGKRYIKAWYASNTSINALKDRWCGYVREGGNIVEYSARSGKVPRSLEGASFEAMDANQLVFISEDLLDDTRDFDNRFTGLKQRRFSLIENSGQEVVFSDDDAIFLPKQRATATSDDAIKIAKEYLGKDLPEDAVLEGVDMIDADASTAAYRVRFTRQKDGLTIRGNVEEHHIEILVNNDKVAAVSKLWPDVIEIAGSSFESLVSVNQSAEKLGDYLSSIVRNPVKILSVSPCVGNTSDEELVPAHCFEDDQETIWVVNASTGEVVE